MGGISFCNVAVGITVYTALLIAMFRLGVVVCNRQFLYALERCKKDVPILRLIGQIAG